METPAPRREGRGWQRRVTREMRAMPVNPAQCWEMDRPTARALMAYAKRNGWVMTSERREGAEGKPSLRVWRLG